MKNRALLDFALIFVTYALYLAVTLIVSLAATGDMTEALSTSSLTVLGVSLTCALMWYVLGEWGFRSWTSPGTWYSVWFLLVVVILVTAGVMGLVSSLRLPDMALTLTMFLGGVGFYYLATMLFSPFHNQFLIWPSKHVRSW